MPGPLTRPVRPRLVLACNPRTTPCTRAGCPLPAAYIKSVLCPSLTPRPGADTSGPPTPTSARPPAEGFPAGPLTATQRHYHRARSSFGSMQLDAEYMRELDRVRGLAAAADGGGAGAGGWVRGTRWVARGHGTECGEGGVGWAIFWPVQAQARWRGSQSEAG